MKHLAFALIAALLPTVAYAQQAVDEELPPGMAPDEPSTDYLLGAPEEEGPTQPHRIFATAGGGTSVRIIKDRDFVQDRFAPAYLDLFGAFVFGSAGDIRHGVGLGASFNLTGDGSAEANLGPDTFEQVVLLPSYLAYMRFGWDLVLTGKASVGFALGSETSMGVEVAVGGVYYFLAGLGLYAELGGSAWLGAENTIHPLVSLDGGIAIDYEVLP